MATTPDKLPVVLPADWMPGPQQGQWTYKDYAALPDDGKRYEIINGVLLMAPAPYWSHQEIVLEIASYLRAYLRTTRLGGVFVAPVDVELFPDNVYQPDVVVLLKENREKLQEHHIVGAPDLVVEVASTSSVVTDRLSKYDNYERAGVPEYWIVRPDTQAVELFVLDGETYHSLGIFHGQDMLPSQILPELQVRVEQFFVSVWS